MAPPQVHVFIDDGPRGGDDLMIDAAADGSPPPTIVLPDPAVRPPQIEEQAAPIYSTPGQTTYVLGDYDDRRRYYVYRQWRAEAMDRATDLIE